MKYSLLFLVIIIMSSLSNINANSPNSVNTDSLQGVYTIKYCDKGSYFLKKRYSIDSMTIILRKDHTVLFGIKYEQAFDDIGWGTDIGQGNWSVSDNQLTVCLNEISPALYPIIKNSHEIEYISYPFSRNGVFGDLKFKIQKDKNHNMILTSKGLELKRFLCEMDDNCGMITVLERCNFMNKRDENCSTLKTWEERLSNVMIDLNTDTFPRSLNPLPIDISKDSVRSRIDEGRKIYESSDNLVGNHRISYNKFLRLRLIPLPANEE